MKETKRRRAPHASAKLQCHCRLLLKEDETSGWEENQSPNPLRRRDSRGGVLRPDCRWAAGRRGAPAGSGAAARALQLAARLQGRLQRGREGAAGGVSPDGARAGSSKGGSRGQKKGTKGGGVPLEKTRADSYRRGSEGSQGRSATVCTGDPLGGGEGGGSRTSLGGTGRRREAEKEGETEEKGGGGEGLGRGWGALMGFSKEGSGGTAAGVGNGGRGPGVSSDGRGVGGPGLRGSGSAKSDRNIHLQSLRPPPRTETGPKRKDTAGFRGSGGLSLASWPPSDVTPPRRACAWHARQAGGAAGLEWGGGVGGRVRLQFHLERNSRLP